MVRIDGEDDIDKQEIAELRRQAAGRPPLDILEEIKTCFNCHQAILTDLRTMENNPNYLRLNVLSPATSRACTICNARQNIHRMSMECRVNMFVFSNIYVPLNVRICQSASSCRPRIYFECSAWWFEFC